MIDMLALQKMSTTELRDLREAIHVITEVISGFICQPRFEKDEAGTSNEAGDMLESIVEFLRGYEQADMRAPVPRVWHCQYPSRVATELLSCPQSPAELEDLKRKPS